MSDALGGASLGNWRCRYCGESYLRADTLERHIEETHEDGGGEDEP